MKSIIENRYTIAKILAWVATIINVVSIFFYSKGNAYEAWIIGIFLGVLLALIAYCFGGFGAALKSSLTIAKWGWIVVPFPYDLATFVIALFFSIIAFFLIPIIPIRKAYKESMTSPVSKVHIKR